MIGLFRIYYLPMGVCFDVLLSTSLVIKITKEKRALSDLAKFVVNSRGAHFRTTVMMRIVVDKSTDHAKPHSICFLSQYQK